MNSRKRQASDPLLPLRSSKVLRTIGDLPSSLPSRWFDQLLIVSRETLSYFSSLVEEDAPRPPSLPSTHPPSSRFRTPDAPLGTAESSQWYRSPAPPPETPAILARRPRSPHLQHRPRSPSSINPSLLRPPALSVMSPEQTHTPPHPSLPHFSSSVNHGDPTAFPLGDLLTSPHEPPGRQNPKNHIHRQSEQSRSTIRFPPPSSNASSVPPRRSDFTHSAFSQPTSSALPLSTEPLQYIPSMNDSYLSNGHSLDSALRLHRSTDSFYGIPRNYQNKDHIFAKQHKSSILAQQKKDREEMMRELYQLKRSAGYTSDFTTFQGYLDYAERLLLLESRGALSPSPSLTDLRSLNRTPAPSRRHSISGDFLERALEKAREALNGPKPPKPFHPSLDQLQVSARAKDEEIERRLRGPKQQPLPDQLPPEDEDEIDFFLTKRGVVSKFSREQVTDKDISRLRPGQWLNDEIINFYGQLIMSRSEACKENPGVNGVNGVSGKKKALNIFYFSTFFWSKLKGDGYEKGRLAKWTKKDDLFQKDIILIPINHNNSHWSAAAINFRRKRIESYDSMNMDPRHIYKLLRAYVDAEHRNKKKKPFDFTGWKDHTLPDTPQQENGYDCGVFTCQFLAGLARGEEKFSFRQHNMNYFRRRMIWEICHATLRDDT